MHVKAMLFAATKDSLASRQFYERALGLQFIAEQEHALVFDINGVVLRVQKVKNVVAVPYTSLGFEVADIQAIIAQLAASGVHCEQYSFMEQDAVGVWTTNEGTKIAWLKDPDGNTLSLTQNP